MVDAIELPDVQQKALIIQQRELFNSSLKFVLVEKS